MPLSQLTLQSLQAPGIGISLWRHPDHPLKGTLEMIGTQLNQLPQLLQCDVLIPMHIQILSGSQNLPLRASAIAPGLAPAARAVSRGLGRVRRGEEGYAMLGRPPRGTGRAAIDTGGSDPIHELAILLGIPVQDGLPVA